MAVLWFLHKGTQFFFHTKSHKLSSQPCQLRVEVKFLSVTNLYILCLPKIYILEPWPSMGWYLEVGPLEIIGREMRLWTWGP